LEGRKAIAAPDESRNANARRGRVLSAGDWLRNAKTPWGNQGTQPSDTISPHRPGSPPVSAARNDSGLWELTASSRRGPHMPHSCSCRPPSQWPRGSKRLADCNARTPRSRRRPRSHDLAESTPIDGAAGTVLNVEARRQSLGLSRSIRAACASLASQRRSSQQFGD